MTRAFLALGSNLGDREAELRRAVGAMTEVVAASAVYETDPVGGPEGQGPYLNMVVQLETKRSPQQLLETCRSLEAVAGRVRDVHWGPRTLDVDVIWIDGVTVTDDDLEVPHPRFRERPFVLAPLAELAPDIVPAGWEEDFDHLGVYRLGPLQAL
jgi:2-amino-4-hydroxy-6-hydroxymethyldihydropteridine diphosphokinase